MTKGKKGKRGRVLAKKTVPVKARAAKKSKSDTSQSARVDRARSVSPDREMSSSIIPSTGGTTPEDAVMADATSPPQDQRQSFSDGEGRENARGPQDAMDVDTASAASPSGNRPNETSTTVDPVNDSTMGDLTNQSNAAVVPVDIMHTIPGMYRILDLVNEQSSGGLVDKIIISQESFGDFVNAICPSAYLSMTHVNFNALDQLSIKPLGLYGSKEEIVRYIKDLDIINDATAELLRKGKDDMPPSQTLRSGLYLLRDASRETVYVIFWPQDATWDDDAISAVVRNRVTFMRYLTKIADQIVALISDEHARDIVWGSEDAPDPGSDSDDMYDLDNVDRLYTFEVAKTREEQENVTASTGFKITTDRITAPHPPDDAPVNPAMLAPRLVNGENALGLMTVSYEAASRQEKRRDEEYQQFRLKAVMAQESFVLDEALSEDALMILGQQGGLHELASEAWLSMMSERDGARNAVGKQDKESIKALEDEMRGQNALLVAALSADAAAEVMQKFPTFSKDELLPQPAATEEVIEQGRSLLQNLTSLHPSISKKCHDLFNDPKLKKIKIKPFSTRKEQLLRMQTILDEAPDMPLSEQQARLREVLDGRPQSSDDPPARGSWNPLTKLWEIYKPGNTFASGTSDAKGTSIKDEDFMALIPSLTEKYPVLVEAVGDALSVARQHFSGHIAKEVNKLVHSIEELRLSECKKVLKVHSDKFIKSAVDASRVRFLDLIKDSFRRDVDRHLHIMDVQQVRPAWGMYGQGGFRVSGVLRWKSDASLKYRISLLQLTQDDKHAMQLDPSHIPTPLPTNAIFTFGLSLQQTITHIQLLRDGRCLLITSKANGDAEVYLDNFLDIDKAIQLRRTKKLLHSEKLGGRFLLAFDETKRMLAVCSREKLQLHILFFDEQYKTLQALGNVVDLRPWYDQATTLSHIVLRCGSSEELAIVEEDGRTRLFSIVTQQFRPAALQLLRSPAAIFSSPDGSCFITVDIQASTPVFQAYHWASFGSSQGICIELPQFPIDQLTMTSFVDSTRCHLVGLDVVSQCIQSTSLHITHKSTEFTFKANDSHRRRSNTSETATAHNSLIDCHENVWTRFPVVPAVRRRTFKSSLRFPRSLTFVSRLSPELFGRYYHDLATSFEKRTRKPVNAELSGVKVSGIPYSSFMKGAEIETSKFKAGEWLVDILCLIPIHIAVARDNRFVPLKDGVWSGEFERALLGATVEQVTDKLSFGWYESIFSSYMATMPVRVVSSMGEQSVGKSFALNHLVDTSFAGSAMRTTEGVWMSVTPTDEALIVALDFEGVHSIERSAQEDSLLVLFNAALSNMVLFRNNFAMSRDITGLFQSFQSSATVLDPAANPSLFKSTLVIIVKDVVDSDKKEIMKEFSLKFQQIVAVEQESNFITRLHAGKLAIMPWPVIESREFYTLFPVVKKMLDRQPVTHGKAGVFLQTMKTLMAKLKTNDWGSLDQNLATHRAQQLQALLPMALRFGGTEVEPVFEPLKDIDNGIDLIAPGDCLTLPLYVPSLDSSEQEDEKVMALKALQEAWDDYGNRADAMDDGSWVTALEAYLQHCVTSRLQHVDNWLDVNTARFSTDLTTFQALRREYEALAVSVKAGVQLCKMQCTECHLQCLNARHHSGPHDCLTSHKCPRGCTFTEEHSGDDTPCGLPAGHTGQHICDIATHLCGKPCRLSGKTGCLERCSKLASHMDDQHLCPASSHECGMPCSLANIQIGGGSTYTCKEVCRISSEQHHELHVCRQQSCPIKCQLCGRLCAEPDHFHALGADAVHLCGQEHTCSGICQAQGICRIETTPQAVEATFTGRHDTFQYTKYSQEARKLGCVIAIPVGATEHQGCHKHSLAHDAFHYCEERCDYCGYFCTLPLGHTQQEHETSHGSMSKTRWAVEGPDTSVIEVNGRKFGANDDGAPLLCSMICKDLGRHVHLDYCRTQPGDACSGAGIEHLNAPLHPHPGRAKDFVTHDLFWRRTGFKDPYSQDARAEFAKCDAMCPGKEHVPDANGKPQPSYCTLPLFHAPSPSGQANTTGYVSGDGHHFSCRNPALLQQAFHVMFVIDRSGSMAITDRRPLSNIPVTRRIAAQHNNRIGAVYSSLYMFWNARHGSIGAGVNRRDSYSVILFDDALESPITNDFARTPDQLLDQVIRHPARGGTNYSMALQAVQTCMENHWSTERTPVIIFLSDGECSVSDAVVRDLSRRAIALGRALSFHSVSFGPNNQVLRRMADIAGDVQRTAPPDPMHPTIPSQYVEALDSVRLAETFLGIADSLTKPRGALMHA